MRDNIELLSSDELKEQQIINELQLKINKQKEKVSKKVTRQKILLGAFLVDLLENNRVQGLNDYVARALPDYLTRAADRKLLKNLVENLGGVMPDEEKVTSLSDYRSDK